ncbi:hypothetical protein [Sinosporangium siamense]|uniref:Uncharacterized protein n=1 Tax=Sinosporangium siamense TaxID=1367973 RepID=A0A919RNR3_9ACTN|nr:hypothetical protein [Sinosporangium siamense]GII95591.1 hypothetical protein Ssi02_58220 [Sinosporangium siamense]
MFSQIMYPSDPKAMGPASSWDNPNNANMMRLGKSQLAAYKVADKACYRSASGSVLGKEIDSDETLYSQSSEAMRSREDRALNGDAKLLELAQPFGDCLTGKGYSVKATNPTSLAARGRELYMKKMRDFQQTQSARQGGDGGEGGVRLRPEDARPLHQAEVKDALDDLTCGKDFYSAYQPKWMEINTKVREEFGMP